MKLKLNTKASDWCTMWPDTWREYDYSLCCQQHDLDYANPFITRWDADVALLICVKNSSQPFLAVIMFIGVRCFGWMFKHYTPAIH